MNESEALHQTEHAGPAEQEEGTIPATVITRETVVIPEAVQTENDGIIPEAVQTGTEGIIPEAVPTEAEEAGTEAVPSAVRETGTEAVPSADGETGTEEVHPAPEEVADEMQPPAMAQKESAAIEGADNILRRHIIDDPRAKRIARHKAWLANLQHEYPMPYVPYRIGVYIRYYNQTKYPNYLEKHVQQFVDDIAVCRKWTLVDFYIDTGPTAPRMESSPEWCRLLADCLAGKVDLIVTQKASSVSSDWEEIAFISRMLAAQPHPIGIYFISDDIFTLASYYRGDLRDRVLDVAPLPLDELDEPMVFEGERSLLASSTYALPGKTSDDRVGDSTSVETDGASGQTHDHASSEDREASSQGQPPNVSTGCVTGKDEGDAGMDK